MAKWLHCPLILPVGPKSLCASLSGTKNGFVLPACIWCQLAMTKADTCLRLLGSCTGCQVEVVQFENSLGAITTQRLTKQAHSTAQMQVPNLTSSCGRPVEATHTPNGDETGMLFRLCCTRRQAWLENTSRATLHNVAWHLLRGMLLVQWLHIMARHGLRGILPPHSLLLRCCTARHTMRRYARPFSFVRHT